MRKFREVYLVFCENEGNYGLTHEKTAPVGRFPDMGTYFDPFWDGYGVFHDVFEHWFEKVVPEFGGQYAMNIGGEMAAMGACSYFYHEIGVNRFRAVYQDSYQIIGATTYYMLMEGLRDGWFNFGEELLSNVPLITESPSIAIEKISGVIMETIQGITPDTDDEWVLEQINTFRESITYEKVISLHEWGWKMAQRTAEVDHDANYTLSTFIEFWNGFTKGNSARKLHSEYKGIKFKLYHDKGRRIRWTAQFVPRYPKDKIPEELLFKKIDSDDL